MQMVESSNQYYQNVDKHIIKAMDDFKNLTGREYKPFEYQYYGTSAPRVAIITMGSSVAVVNSTLKAIQNEQACLVGVRMFRPWNAGMFVNAIPESVKRIAVLDRTREGALLQNDMVQSIQQYDLVKY
jgi:pyruvate-ferredoxin/flavodoxin oxidoreductase